MVNNPNNEPFYDNKGRPNDETKPEHNAKRPLENSPSNGKKSSNSSHNSSSKNSTPNGGSMSSNPQNLQKQIDVCVDFCAGIDEFKANCIKSKILTDGYINEAEQAQAFKEFFKQIREHQRQFDNLLDEIQKLLDKHQDSFKTTSLLIAKRMERVNLKAVFSNDIKGGLKGQTKNMSGKRDDKK